MTTATAIQPRAGRDGERARLGLVVAVAAIVLGILGMHALTAHGTLHGPGMSGMTGMSATPTTNSTVPTTSKAVAGDMSGMDHQRGTWPTATHGVTPAADALAGASTGDSHGGQMGSMVMLCAVMLAAAAGAALLLLALGRTSATWRTIPPALRAVITRTTARLATGPPPVWEFSVIRC